ncbi:unnamed protein product [Paramecium sonneborni]|uniref:Uncharacterized protein n=1 Tax=Paramecium sonneborni TaxID=65129 RepID=A0A8S1R227_9CILI|nr:unnamed protein product [Paramecium sonneborni]
MFNTKITFLISCLMAITLQARLDINSPECNYYLEKFGTANNADGTGASQIAFSGDIGFIDGTANVLVNLRYSDVKFYNDAKYFGLVQEDGKTPEDTCLDLKLYRFSSNTYSDKSEVTTLKLTHSSSFQKQWRYYSFTILGEDLKTYLIETKNSEQYIYNGYFALAYYAADTDQLQYTFYFEFQVIVNRNNGAAIDTAFKPLSAKSTVGCSLEASCTAKPDTQLVWCKDAACTEQTTPNLHLNDQFFLKQAITTKGMEGYFLTGVEVWYTGEGLNKKATLNNPDNSVQGQVILPLKAEIAWSKVVIKVTSVLSNTKTGNTRRVLAQTTYDTVSGKSQEIHCIKVEKENRCATCAEQKAINGYSSETCNNVEPLIEDDQDITNMEDYSKQILISIILLLAIII